MTSQRAEFPNCFCFFCTLWDLKTEQIWAAEQLLHNVTNWTLTPATLRDSESETPGVVHCRIDFALEAINGLRHGLRTNRWASRCKWVWLVNSCSFNPRSGVTVMKCACVAALPANLCPSLRSQGTWPWWSLCPHMESITTQWRWEWCLTHTEASPLNARLASFFFSAASYQTCSNKLYFISSVWIQDFLAFPLRGETELCGSGEWENKTLLMILKESLEPSHFFLGCI